MPENSDPATESLEKLIDGCLEFIVPRSTWDQPTKYPSPNSCDGTMWAWEFLRRNGVYADDFEEFVIDCDYEDPKYYAHAMAVAWNVSKLLDPAQSFEDLLRPPSAGRAHVQNGQQLAAEKIFPVSRSGDGSPLWVAGTVPHIELPCFGPSEGRTRGPSFFANGRIRAVTEHPMFLAANQVAVRITLDADLDSQLKAIRAALRDPQRDHFTTQYQRFLIVVEELSDDLQEPNASAYKHQLDRIQVHQEHLWLALRSVDALQLVKAGAVTPGKLPELLRTCFNDESLTWSHVDPKSKKFGKLQSRADVDRTLRYGLRYTLNGGYVRVASSNLSSQAL